MKVLILAKGYPPTIGGVENYSYYLAEGLGANHQVKVVTFEDPDNDVGDNTDQHAQVSRLQLSDSELWNGWSMMKALKKKLDHFTPDLIIATTWKVGIPYSLLKYRHNIPFVLIAHGAEMTRHVDNNFLMKSMQFVIGQTDLIISVSNFTKEIVLKYSGTDKMKIKTVSNGIDLDSIQPIDKQKAREKLGLNGDRPILLTVSRLDDRKGHARLLELMSELINSYPNLFYVIVGNGPLKSELISKAEELDLLEKHVLFTGFVSDQELTWYYSAADIFIMLNEMNSEKDFEGFGFVFAEAGAYGKPVIGGNNAGPKEVIDDGETGYLVDPNDKGQIKSAISEMLDNPIKREHMGERGREKVMSNFTKEVMVRKIEEQLRQVIG